MVLFRPGILRESFGRVFFGGLFQSYIKSLSGYECVETVP